ncbi:hypothetical protein GGX14DRAFT_678972 [Mycena pura]|uniref:DUF6534 domain-containing protein n=1 Tax=Mycena pura TaxID=153505 RepID=A0AAD6UTW8_9AGAR|nr:hypothetical protein GGX14DRAFT_678972 [Mycena pura]
MAQLPSVPPFAQGGDLDIPFSLDATIGALEIGVLVAVFLSGVLIVQVYVYFVRYPRDPLGFKFMVAFAWLLDIGHTFASHALYTITITQYGQPWLLAVLPKSFDVTILLSGLLGPLEQGWFTYRLYRFTKTLPLPLLCVALSLLRLGGSTTLFVAACAAPTIQNYIREWKWVLEAVVIVGASVDVILALALCYYLSSWRQGGFQRTSKLVHQLMTWTIETGAITTAGALMLLLTFLTMQNNLVYLAFYVLMGKWFANSLLFSLNARERFARICAEGMSLAQLTSPVHTVQFSSTPPSPIDRDPEAAQKRPWQSYAPGAVALADRPARSSASHDAPP